MSDNLKSSLSHVLWIGGGTDTGKTSIAEEIASRYDLQVYPSIEMKQVISSD